MIAVVGLAMRRGPVVTTAFSIMSMSTVSSRNAPNLSTCAYKRYSMSASKSSVCKSFFGSSNCSARPSSSLASTLISSPTTTGVDLQKNFDTTHPAFEVLEKDIVTEYGAYCTLYRHTKSGAELLSVSVDDDNKVFGITLRTPPEDSTGVPHILEHSVLCGSRKYTTKDPFVHLLKGSLQTFLNAFTYPDRTCYVVASQNVKDFYNLVNVYADAVYHPRAVNDPMVHAQEGWHLELDEEEDRLFYNGVV